MSIDAELTAARARADRERENSSQALDSVMVIARDTLVLHPGHTDAWAVIGHKVQRAVAEQPPARREGFLAELLSSAALRLTQQPARDAKFDAEVVRLMTYHRVDLEKNWISPAEIIRRARANTRSR